MMNSTTDNEKSLPEKLSDDIVSYILNNHLEPNDKLPNESILAEKMGVGRSSIREAMKLLASRNIVTIRQGSGTYIASSPGIINDPLGFTFIENKQKLAEDLLSVRFLLEPSIAGMAAANASEKDIEKISQLCKEVETLILSEKNHTEKDIEFHTFIAKCSKNQVVELLLPVIHTAVLTFANVTHRLLRDETIRTHRAITEAILARDSVGARCAMITHLTYNRQTIMKIICERNSKDMEKTSDV